MSKDCPSLFEPDRLLFCLKRGQYVHFGTEKMEILKKSAMRKKKSRTFFYDRVGEGFLFAKADTAKHNSLQYSRNDEYIVAGVVHKIGGAANF